MVVVVEALMCVVQMARRVCLRWWCAVLVAEYEPIIGRCQVGGVCGCLYPFLSLVYLTYICNLFPLFIYMY